MMRWIVRSSLQFRFIVVALAVGMVGVRRDPGAATCRSTSSRSSRRRSSRCRPRAWGCRPRRSRPSSRSRWSRRSTRRPASTMMRSTTVPGLSAITLIFNRGTDRLEARQLVNERVATAIPSLPASAGIPWTLQPLSATSRAMKIGLTCDRCDLTDLSMIAYWTMRWRLMAVPGVANVVDLGRPLEAAPVPDRPGEAARHTASRRLRESVASDALDFGLLKYTDAAKNRVGGFIDTPNQRLGIHHVLPGVHARVRWRGLRVGQAQDRRIAAQARRPRQR